LAAQLRGGGVQGTAPVEQLLIRRINRADSAMLKTMEPRQPKRFEKKTNI
jgi:hypothetical protein